MTGTDLQRKRSKRRRVADHAGLDHRSGLCRDRGGFLVAASDSQNTARLASAKVDIANREDALMREILQQTATGMLPSTDGVTP